MVQGDARGEGLHARSQLEDYQHRPAEFEDFNIIDLFVNTYEESITSAPDTSVQRSGPIPHVRGKYHEPHQMSSKLHRKARQLGHNYLPNFIGKAFPRADDTDEKASENHAACMLLLLKPWRSIQDLKRQNETWSETLVSFKGSASVNTIAFIANVQHFHRCKDAAEMEPEAEHRDVPTNLGQDDEEIEIDDDICYETVPCNPDDPPTAQEWRELEASKIPIQAYEQARLAVFQGERSHFFSNTPFTFNNSSKFAEGEDYVRLGEWMAALSAKQGEATNINQGSNDDSSVTRLEESGISATVQNIDETMQALEPINLDALNEKQRQAYDIVHWVKKERDTGRNPPQLLMILHGEGGTGKSRVIQTISEIYKRSGEEKKLAKIAYTGIAASIIEGETIHRSIRMRPQTANHVGDKVRGELQARWGTKQLLIIDEISMVPKELFATISNRIHQGRSGLNPEDLPFGGLDVLICGDFHQFPPVAKKATACLYVQEGGAEASDFEGLRHQGRNIFARFRDCVVLREQMRVRDDVWMGFLRRIRTGGNTSEDMEMLRSLIVDETSHELGTDDWAEAKLVTPRHITKDLWNKRALLHNSAKRGKQIYTWESEKSVHGIPSSERTAIELERHKQGQRGVKTHLPRLLSICEGAEVMVTINLDTDIDLANGTRAVVERIVLAADEPPIGTDQIVNLQKMPLYILVRLQSTRAIRVSNLEQNVIPIAPFDMKHYIKYSRGPAQVKETVTERQFPLILGYAFTDYRSQGQTLRKVIVDLATPHTGKPPNLFNFYVALSRSTGRENIRLLRSFDESIFEEALPAALIDEDDRLIEMDNQTERHWRRTEMQR